MSNILFFLFRLRHSKFFIFLISNLLVISQFQLKGKSRKIFDIIVSTKSVFFFNSDLGDRKGAAALQPAALGCAVLAQHY
jgi:hypothetical protein